MNFTGFNLHQGDSQFFGITSIPKEAQKIDKQYIAASERSGSFHALFGDYDMYAVKDGFVIDAKEECILNHSPKTLLEGTGVTMDEKKVLEKKDHRHTMLPKGVYYVGIQNIFDPLSGIKQKVRD